MIRVTIVQDYLATYRDGFYRELLDQASLRDVSISVVVGAAGPVQRDRGDTSATPVSHVRHREISVGGRRIAFRHLRHVMKNSDVVVLEQARRNIDLYRLFLPRRRTKIVLWGHGRDFVKSPSWLERRVWDALTRRADHLLLYTQSGFNYAVKIGVNPSRITVLKNSTDIRETLSQISSLTAQDLEQFKQRSCHGRDYVLYIGGLDRAKGLSGLWAVARALQTTRSSTKLVIAGEGKDRPEVERLCNQFDSAVYLGRLEGREKALALAGARMLIVPGRVGLVAVDSIAAGVPLATREQVHHAPEYEYLVPGVSIISVDGDDERFACVVLDSLNDPDLMSRIRHELELLRPEFGVEAMAKQFLDGLTRADDHGK